jgi:hypothetical protein
MQIQQHVPSFFEGFTPECAGFETLEELERVPFVARWSAPREPPRPHRVLSWDKDGKMTESEETLPAAPPFKRFSFTSERSSRRDTLMAEMENGSWWVVGFMDKGAGERLCLPRWDAPQR